MKIDISNGQFYYDLFYQFSFFLVIIILLIEGYKRKFPWSTWLLLIVTVRVFAIIGSKFGAITPEDFRYFTEHLQFPSLYNKNVVGALLFGFIGIGFSKWLLKVRYPVLDAFAIAVPFGMAIQRIGCLMVGCCYGTETHLPWGIQYGVHAPAFFHQFFAHQIGSSATLSLSIHPVPLYFIVSSLLTGIVLIIYRQHWKRPGNLALFGLLLLMASRFVIEFFRASESNGSFQGNYFLGLKVVQLFCLAVVIVLSVVIPIREKHTQIKIYSIAPNDPLYNTVYLFMLSVILYATGSWFSPVEFQVLMIVLIPAALSVVYQLMSHYYSTGVRISTAWLMILSVFLMSQNVPEKDATTTSYHSIRLGYSGGKFTNDHNIGQGTGCDRNSYTETFRQQYALGGLGYSTIKKDREKVLEYGLNGYFGSLTETRLSTNTQRTTSIYGINPFIRSDYKWIGVGAGVHIGGLKLTPFYWEENATPTVPTTGVMNTFIYPQLYARVGIEKYAFLAYHLGDQVPAPFPAMYSYIEIGSGLGFKNGLKVSLGVNLESASILKLSIPIENKLVIEPVFQWRRAKLNAYDVGYNNNPDAYNTESQFSIALQYLLK